MSLLNVDKIDPNSGTALEIGTSGDTVTVPTGVGLTLTNATLLLPTTITSTTEVLTNKISPATGVAFALGDSGDTFTVPSGATIVNSGTATGFGGGKVGQVLQAVKTDTFGSYTTAAYAEVTDLTVDITPVATSSKVLIMVSICYGQANDAQGAFQIAKDGSALTGAIGDTASARTRGTLPANNPQASSAYTSWNSSMTYLDAPSSTSAITYSVQVYAASSQGLYVNRTYSDTDTDDGSRTISSITVMEILV